MYYQVVLWAELTMNVFVTVSHVHIETLQFQEQLPDKRISVMVRKTFESAFFFKIICIEGSKQKNVVDEEKNVLTKR